MPKNTTSSHTLLFRFAAMTCTIILFYHINKYFFPGGTNESATRHLAFVGICTVCIFGLLKRPRWFRWFFGILMVQQLFSHGSRMVQEWGKIPVMTCIDVAIVVGMPIIFAALITSSYDRP